MNPSSRRSSQSVLGDPMEAWKARGRELNAIYDALAQVVHECAPGFDPVEDVKALGAERDRLRTENERMLSDETMSRALAALMRTDSPDNRAVLRAALASESREG